MFFQKYILILAFVCCWQSIIAQSGDQTLPSTDSLAIYLIASPQEDSILLRWAPLNLSSWLLGNQLGYQVSRTTISRGGKMLNNTDRQKSKKLLANNIKHYSQETWVSLLETSEDDNLWLAAGTLFDEQFTVDYNVKSPLDMNKIEENRLRKTQRHTFALFAADQSFAAATALGLSFVDRSVKKNEGYAYQVTYIKMPEEKALNYKKGQVIVPINVRQQFPSPLFFKGVFGDKVATLSWDNEAVKNFYISYIIERSEDGGKQFEQRNQKPIVFLAQSDQHKLVFYEDSLAENNKEYIYRIRGKTPFGNYGTYSDTVVGKSIPDPLPVLPIVYDVIEFPAKNIQLKWQFDKAYNDAISGFQIYRAPTSTGPFLPILKTLVSPTERIFIDPLPISTAYYFVSALDTNGYQLSSVPVLAQLVDLKPPVPPLNVVGKLDEETGIVSLNWSANKEDDLAGYRIFFSNQEKVNFSQVSKSVIRDTFFTHPIAMNTASEEIYFTVVATDFRENFSPFSVVCVVKRPDKIPPTSPLIRKVNAFENRIVLTYATSSSRDIVSHKIERKIRNSSMDWETLSKDTLQEIEIKEFEDVTAEYENEYEYRITATDDANLVTSSKSVISKLIDQGIRDSIDNFQVFFIEETDKIKHTIQWNYPSKWEIKEFVLYRGINESKITTYKIIKPEEVLMSSSNPEFEQYSFSPDSAKSKITYSYRLMARLNKGNMSPLTDIVIISTDEK